MVWWNNIVAISIRDEDIITYVISWRTFCFLFNKRVLTPICELHQTFSYTVVYSEHFHIPAGLHMLLHYIRKSVKFEKSFPTNNNSVPVGYVALRTIVLSCHRRYRAILWIFWGLA